MKNHQTPIHEIVKYHLKVNYDVKDVYCKVYSNKAIQKYRGTKIINIHY